jgi:hypothetical protein
MPPFPPLRTTVQVAERPLVKIIGAQDSVLRVAAGTTLMNPSLEVIASALPSGVAANTFVSCSAFDDAELVSVATIDAMTPEPIALAFMPQATQV